MAFIERLRYILSLEGSKEFKDKMGDAEKATKKGSEGIIGNFKKIAQFAKIYFASQAVRYIGQAVVAMGNAAEQSRVLGTSFERLAKGIGQNSERILAAITKGAQGTVSQMDMMRQANQAILLGIPVTAAQMEELSRVALRLGRAVGRGPADALGDLITGFGRMSPLILDNLGLTLKAEEAYENYAKSIGKTVEQLTDAEKRIGFFSEGMKKARERSEQLGEMTGGLTERWAKLGAQFEDVQVKAGQLLLPWLEKAVDLLGGITSGANAAVDALSNLAKGSPERGTGPSLGAQIGFPGMGGGYAGRGASVGQMTRQDLIDAMNSGDPQQAAIARRIFFQQAQEQARTTGTGLGATISRNLRRSQALRGGDIDDETPAVRGEQSFTPNLAINTLLPQKVNNPEQLIKDGIELLAKAEVMHNTPVENREIIKLPGRKEIEVWNAELGKMEKKIVHDYEMNVLKPIRKLSDTEFENMWAEAEDIAKSSGEDVVDVYERVFQQISKSGSEEFKKMTDTFEQNMTRSVRNIEQALTFVGVEAKGFFGGLQKGLSAFRSFKSGPSPESIIALTGAMRDLAMYVGNLATPNYAAMTDPELSAYINKQTDGGKYSYNVLGQRIPAGSQGAIQSGAEKELARRAEGGVAQPVASSGSQAFSSAARITEVQADAILATLNTMALRDTRRNEILTSMDGRLANVEFFVSIRGMSAFSGVL